MILLQRSNDKKYVDEKKRFDLENAGNEIANGFFYFWIVEKTLFSRAFFYG